MKKIVTIVLLVLMTTSLIYSFALAAPDDTSPSVPPDSTIIIDDTLPSPSPSPAQSTSVLLSKVAVSSVKQGAISSTNTMNVTVELKNLNNVDLSGIMVGVGGQSASTISLTKTFGPFAVNLPANGTGSVSFTLYVSPLIMGGNFPLTLDMTYVDSAGVLASDIRDISILISREAGAFGSVVNPISSPRVILSDYSIGADKIAGNSTFDLSFTLKNTGTVNVNNLIITLASDSNSFVPSPGTSNQIYVGSIGAGQDFAGKVTLTANSTLATGKYNVNFAMQYQDTYNNSYTSAAQISISLEQQQKLSINKVTIQDSCVLGSKALLNVSYKNPGKTDIKNLVMNLKGNIGDKEKTVTIGTVLAGASGYVDQYITPSLAGQQQIDISFTFEDSDGNTYTTQAEPAIITVKGSNTSASPGVTSGTSSTPDGQNQGTSQDAGFDINSLWIVILLVGVVIVVVCIVYFVVIRGKKKTKKWDKVTK